MPDSKRERVLAAMEAVFTSATGPNGTAFGGVYDAPYEGREHRGKNVLSIIEGPEVYLPVVSPDKLDRRIDVELAALAHAPRGVKPRAAANLVLSDMEYIVEANNKWDGEAYATLFISNTIERINTGDRTVEVVLFVQVQYRTKRSDPNA